jgi:hypothetical protein
MAEAPDDRRLELLQGTLDMLILRTLQCAAGGYVLARVAARFFEHVKLPGALPIPGASAVLVTAAVLAYLTPAARASRVDVLQALRSE